MFKTTRLLMSSICRSAVYTTIFGVVLLPTAHSFAQTSWPACFNDGNVETRSETGGARGEPKYCIFRPTEGAEKGSPNPTVVSQDNGDTFVVKVDFQNRCSQQVPASFAQALYGCDESGCDNESVFATGEKVEYTFDPGEMKTFTLTYDLKTICKISEKKLCDSADVKFQWDFDLMLPDIENPKKAVQGTSCDVDASVIDHGVRKRCWYNSIYGRQGGSTGDGFDGSPCGGTHGVDQVPYTPSDEAKSASTGSEPVVSVGGTEPVVPVAGQPAANGEPTTEPNPALATVTAKMDEAADAMAAAVAINNNPTSAQAQATVAQKAATAAAAAAAEISESDPESDLATAALALAKTAQDSADAAQAHATIVAESIAIDGFTDGRPASSVGGASGEAPVAGTASNDLGSGGGCGGLDLSDGGSSISMMLLALLACLGLRTRQSDCA